MLRVSALVEDAGFPSASLVCEGFFGQAKTTSAGLGYPNLPLAKVPGHVDGQSDGELRANVLAVTVDALIESFTGEMGEVKVAREPAFDEIVFEGSFEEVNRFFIENEWSDGLPIMPPTKEAVARFLEFCDLPPRHVIGTLLPDSREATVWNVAVNGVMAGCRPEYMPILVALAEAMADPGYGVEHSGNTPGAETLIVLNGPLVRELGFNYEQGALRDGFQANTTIGRFWRLYLRNVAGFLLHKNDKGTFGNTWRVVLAENEAHLAKIGWPTTAESEGCTSGSGAVTITRMTGGAVIASVFGDTAEKCLPYLASELVRHTSWELIFTLGFATGTYRPMLILSPLIAEAIAKSGFTKADVQQWLFENARITATEFEHFIWRWTNLVPGRRTLFDMVKLGKAPKVFGQSNDPSRLVPIVMKPSDIMIAVSGDPLRSNCYVFVHNGPLGFPTAKPIVLPRRWMELRQEEG